MITIQPGDPSDKEIYEHIQANLVDFLKDDHGLIGLCEKLRIKGNVDLLHTNEVLDTASHTFLRTSSDFSDPDILSKNLKLQAVEILREGGILAVNGEVHIRKGNQLVSLRTLY